MFFQAGGLAVVLWSRAALAADAGLPDAGVPDHGLPDDGARDDGARAVAAGGVALAHNVRSAREVDALVADWAGAGGAVVREPVRTVYGGYAGYVADPDGHLWEIAYNPGFPLADDGSLTVPDLGPPTGG